MTGFGRAEDVFEGKKITIDIKSLNSKSFDLNIKIPLRYKEKEFEIIHLHIENTNIDIELWKKLFVEIIKSFATFNDCELIKLTKVSPSKLTNKMRQLLT